MFYVDGADVDLNPRIGFSWMKKGEQTAVPTPGKNQKRYLAGALNAQTGQVVWVEWAKKNAEIFVLLLAELGKRYRRARSITVIADNYGIHKSAMTECFLHHHPKIKILFNPSTTRGSTRLNGYGRNSTIRSPAITATRRWPN